MTQKFNALFSSTPGRTSWGGSSANSNTGMLYVANFFSVFLRQAMQMELRNSLSRLPGVKAIGSVRTHGGVVFKRLSVSIVLNTRSGGRTEFGPGSNSKIIFGSDYRRSQDVPFVPGSYEIGPAGHGAGGGWTRSIVSGDRSGIWDRVVLPVDSPAGPGCVVATGGLGWDEFPSNVLNEGLPSRVVKGLKAYRDFSQHEHSAR
jgi:hypothetical protein